MGRREKGETEKYVPHIRLQLQRRMQQLLFRHRGLWSSRPWYGGYAGENFGQLAAFSSCVRRPWLG